MPRPFTFDEWMQLILLGERMKETEDEALGEALIELAQGDESANERIHDRLNVIGRFDLADRLRKLMQSFGEAS